MIALLFALLADPPKVPASIDGLPIGAIGQQALPATGCAAYLFSTGQTRALIAMASAEPATLRIAIDGVTADYARESQSGSGGFGFAASATYRAGEVTATLDMTVATRGDISAGAVVPAATLRVDRAGKDTIVLPVVGLIGCAS